MVQGVLASRWEASISVPASFLCVLYPKYTMSSAIRSDYLGLILILQTEADMYETANMTI